MLIEMIYYVKDIIKMKTRYKPMLSKHGICLSCFKTHEMLMHRKQK